MSDEQHGEAARLVTALQAFAALADDAPNGPRVLEIPADDVHGAFEALLSEIDQTVLPRALTFTASETCAVQLEVSERRILRILALPVDIDAAFPGLMAAPVSPEIAQAVAGALMAFAEGAQTVSVQCDFADAALNCGTAGIPVRELRAFGAPLSFEAAVAESRGFLYVRHCADGQHPIPPEIADSVATLDPDTAAPGLHLWSGDDAGQIMVGTARSGAQCIVLAVKLEQVGSLARIWSRVVGQGRDATRSSP